MRGSPLDGDSVVDTSPTYAGRLYELLTAALVIARYFS